MNLDSLTENWQTPSAAFRGKPFWSWNGKLEENELLRQLRIFAEMGMDGAFLHSRTGLATEYLGDEWFRLTNACADEAEKLGLEAWLYDEDRWPSGSAGGKATVEERFRMRYLRLLVFAPGEDILWPEDTHFVAAFSAELGEKWALGSYTKLVKGHSVPEGQSVLVFAWETMPEHSFYNGSTYLDTLNPEATEHFLRITHDQYKEKCGARLGSSIKGIFTDEPHHGFVFCDTHGQPGPKDTAVVIPWTPRLPEAFREKFGYDLIGRLPELFLRKGGLTHAQIKWEYMELLQQMFLDHWAKPMQERCRELGMILTGHVLHEDSLAAQAVPCGSMMRYYEYLDWPGVDVLGNRNNNYWIVKQLASVGRQLSRPWLLSELYGCTGWQMGLDGHKRIGDWQALFGINVRCHHLSWYSMAGESKRDYPASISFQSAWYPEYEKVETYFSRLHVLLQAGKPLCDVLVLNPVESLWGRIYPGWATWLSARDGDINQLEKIYRDVFTWLTEDHIDFDYGDEDHLARFGQVEGEKPEFVLGAMRYRTVVVAGAETLRGSTLALLEAFSRKGGKVIFAGAPPTMVDVEPSSAPAQLADAAVHVDLSREDLTEAVRSCSPAAQSLRIQADARGLLTQVREDENRRIIVIINPSEDRSYDDVTLESSGGPALTEWDCLSGNRYAVQAESDGGTTHWKTTFAPLQERVFVLGGEDTKTLPPRPGLRGVQETEISGSFPYTLSEPNVAVLDVAELSIEGGEWEAAREILKIEHTLCDRLGVPRRAGDMVQPWATEKKKQSAGPGADIRLKFSFAVEASAGDIPVQLVMETPEKFRVSINEHTLAVPEKTEWFIDPCFRVLPIPGGMLGRDGRVNTIVLETRFEEGVDLEAIYLAGPFGVRLEENQPILQELPPTLHPGDFTSQGLPFYSGRIKLTVPAGNADSLRVEPFGMAAVNCRHPETDVSHCRPWGPFDFDLTDLKNGKGETVVELVLTRRNTFGPLHLIPQKQPAIGPHSFRSKGKNWSDAYQLHPTGVHRMLALA